MKQENPILGLCFSSRQLYYAVKSSPTPNSVQHIGCFDFSFNVAKSIRTQDPETFPAVYDLIGRLKKEFGLRRMHIATVPDHECWTTLPKLVFDNAEEREAHLSIIMKGISRSNLAVSWHELSNREFKLASIRNSTVMNGYQRLSEHVHEANFFSSFELGEIWQRHQQVTGSFMMIHSIPGLISVSAYLLGKLRGATYIQFDDPEDLPYLWLYFANNLKWMTGLYENVYVFGTDVEHIITILRPNIDIGAHIHRFDSLNAIHVQTTEETYGFSLESAFPAILLALGE